MVAITVANGEYLHLPDGEQLFFTEQNSFWIDYIYDIFVSDFGRYITHNLYNLGFNLYLRKQALNKSTSS